MTGLGEIDGESSIPEWLVLLRLDIAARKLDFAIVVLPVHFRKVLVQRDDCTAVLAAAVVATGSGAEQAVREILLAVHKESVHNAVVVAACTHAAVMVCELMLAVVVIVVVVGVCASVVEGTEHVHVAYSDGTVAVDVAEPVLFAGQCVEEEVAAALFDT